MSELDQDQTIGGDASAAGGVQAGVGIATMPAGEGVLPAVQQPERPKRRRWPLVLLLFAVLLAGAYLAGAVAFTNYFLPHTTLNGADVSLKAAGEVARAEADAVRDFSLAVAGEGIDLDLAASDIKARYDGSGFARAALAQQHPWAWPFEITESHRIEQEHSLSYDVMLLRDAIESAVDAANKDATDPVDASVAFDDKAKRYKVVPEKEGTRLDKATVVSEVRAALNEGERRIELSDDVLVRPSLTSDDERLTQAVDKANASLEATQELVARGDVVASVTTEDLLKWVKLDDSLALDFDSEACTAWARGELSERLDTVGSKRSFATPDGRKLTVSGGTYGWSIHGSEIAQTIAENVQAGKKAQIEVTWLQEAKTWNPGGNEWGDTFIEIDLGAQHVRYFEGGKTVWESDCVSGGMNNGKMHSTPTGVYFINSNRQSGEVELRGEIDPKTKKPEYISYVKYWMPFLNNSHALHDADWRSSFGGDIYKTNGSHGCVNLPPDKAKELYGMVGVGTVVVVHD